MSQGSQRKAASRKIVLILVGAIGGVLVLMVAVALPFLRGQQVRSWTQEARTQLYTLCSNVTALHEETGHWMAVGPEPKDIPKGVQVDFPKETTFERLQFDPGKVRYQYRVVVEGNLDGEARVRCVARGDLNGNGVASEATLEIDRNGMLLPVKWKDELE